MLPISDVKIVSADDLRAGDFAYLHAYEMLPVLVIEQGGSTVALYLDPEAKRDSASVSKELIGCATVIRSWEIEVDHLAILREDEPGVLHSIGLRRDDLVLAIVPSRYGINYVKIASAPEPNADVLTFFSNWRIVKRHNGEVTVLYERTRTSTPERE